MLHERKVSKKPGEMILRADIQSLENTCRLRKPNGEKTGIPCMIFFFHPDFTVGSGFLPESAAYAGRGLVCSRSFTAGRELHPTLKNFTFIHLKADFHVILKTAFCYFFIIAGFRQKSTGIFLLTAASLPAQGNHSFPEPLRPPQPFLSDNPGTLRISL